MPYYRHWIKRMWGVHESSMGFVFSEKDAEETKKQLDNDRKKYCEGHSSKDRPMIWHFPVLTHEITQEDFENKKEYTMPIQQVIYRPNLIL